MALRVRIKLEAHRVVQKLRRRKPTGRDTAIQNALEVNAGKVDTVPRAVEDPQSALHLSNSEDHGPFRLLDLPVELLLQILELLCKPVPIHWNERPYSLPPLRLLVHYRFTFLVYSPSTQDMQRIVPPRHSSRLPNRQPRASRAPAHLRLSFATLLFSFSGPFSQDSCCWMSHSGDFNPNLRTRPLAILAPYTGGDGHHRHPIGHSSTSGPHNHL